MLLRRGLDWFDAMLREGRRVRSRKPLIVLAAICLSLADCSPDPEAGAWRFVNATAHFEHSLDKLSSGRNRLVVHAAPGPGQSEDFVAQQARGFAYDVAKKTCPSGYDFFADAPLEAKGPATARHQRTYIFQCR